MAVHVDLCAHGHTCFDNRCSWAARLRMQADGEMGQRTYCLDHMLDRLSVYKTRGEEIVWTDAASSWVESKGRAVVV